MRWLPISGEEIYKGHIMKFKIIFVFMIAVAILLAGGSEKDLVGNLAPGMAYAQVKQLDEETEKAREEEQKGEKIFFKSEEEKEKEKEKIRLPGQMPAVSPETFRMIETIENKNRELKKREEELRIKQTRLEALEAKVRKDLDKIEKSISESKEQMGIQDERTKKNVEALIKVYSSMKPEEAANLVEAIDEGLALQIISGMKSKIAGQVLSNLDVKVAKRISENLAGKRDKPSEKTNSPGN
jgi:flagellar motility protein MotE (MotC chaperone)